jgi:hypothetical protein
MKPYMSMLNLIYGLHGYEALVSHANLWFMAFSPMKPSVSMPNLIYGLDPYETLGMHAKLDLWPITS